MGPPAHLRRAPGPFGPTCGHGSGAVRRSPIPLVMAASTSTTATAARPSARKTAPRTSRAVLRDVEPGSTVECAHCGERVKFQAKVRNRQVICNVYVKGVWDRVEHFHADCYDLA